ncbi:MAG: CHAT domain-containing protein [Cyanobacteria bacterium P01_D01_bin.105]
MSQTAISASHAKAYLILLPFLCVVWPTHSAIAQIIPSEDNAHSVINTVDNQINITQGQFSEDGSNLFHSFEQFDLDKNQIANFITTPTTQHVIGTVNGDHASVIDGTLRISGSSANLYLMNPAGILLGPNAQLNLAGSFNATTATGIEFDNGQLSLSGSNHYLSLTGTPSAFRFEHQHPGAVVNLGNLYVEEGKSITLVGGTVLNEGSLNAPQGSVTLAAIEGSNIVRIQQDKQLLALEVEAIHEVLSGEEIITPVSLGEMLTGGELRHSNQLLRNADGTAKIAVSEVSTSETGGTVIASGILSTIGDLGGNINVLGKQVNLQAAALDASGRQGGGLIRVGGDYRGEGNIVQAFQTLVDNHSSLRADAVDIGNGGNVFVWSDDTTVYDGHLSARGGNERGNGGFAEISGKRELSITGSIDLRAQRGETGTILFDPSNIIITDRTPILGDDNLFFSSDWIEIQSLFTNIILEAVNDIIIEPIPDGELALARGRSITFIADENNLSGGEFRMENPNDVIAVEEGNISIIGAGVTAGKLNIDPNYGSTEENDPTIGNVSIESSKWLNVEEIISERGDVTLSANDEINVGTIDTSSNAHNPGGQTTNGRSLVAAGNVSVESNSNITIGEILTYGLLSAEDHHSPDGGDVQITALGGNIEVQRAIETFSKVQGHEAGSAGNITLTARDNILLNTDNTSGPSLNASSIAETFDSGDGGNISLQALQGNISITGNIEASAEAIDGNGDSSSSAAGNGGVIELIASRNITADGILSRAIAQTDRSSQPGNNAGMGGNIVIRSAEGDTLLGKVEAYSSAHSNNAMGGGSVEITANNVSVNGIDTSTRANSNAQNSGNIVINAQNSVVVDGELESYSYARAGSISRQGGDISIVGNRITTTDRIEAWSAAEKDNSGSGGNVTLRQHNAANDNFVMVDGSIEAYSSAGEMNAGDGGNVLIDIGRDVSANLGAAVAITEHIETASKAGIEEAGNGGSVEIYADTINVSSVDTRSYDIDDDDAGNAGEISLEGDRSIIVGNLLATSTDGSLGNVLLTGDDIELIGDTVAGQLIRLSPFTESQDINVGFNGSASALNLNSSELSQIQGNIELGKLNRAGTGTVTLSDSVLAISQQIDLLGGDRLIGPNVSTDELTYRLEGPGEGSIVGSRIRFFNIENIEGGTGNDIFQPNVGVKIEDFDRISGGAGLNTLTYENFANSAVTVDLSELALNNIQRLVGSASLDNTLKGLNEANQWQLNGQGEGSLNGAIGFENFNNIVGGNDIDVFNVGQITTGTTIIGGDDLDNGQSNNRIVLNHETANWRLTGKNQGTVSLASDIVDFREIQHIESNSADGGEIEVLFAQPDAQITGSINSGNSNLTLIGDNINLGSNLDSGSASGGSAGGGSAGGGNSSLGKTPTSAVSGTGKLTIRPETNNTDILVGSSQSAISNRVNIGVDELAAIQDGFTEIIVGDESITGNIYVRGNVRFLDSVELISQGTLDMTDAQVVVTEGDFTLTSGESVVGGAINNVGGDIRISAKDNISLDELSTIGEVESGDLELVAENGSITTERLITSASSDERGRAGSVNLSSPGSIEVGSIEAEGQGKDSATRRIEIATSDTFTATNSERSLSTAGAEPGQGRIRVTFGNAENEAESFTVGDRSGSNSTAGSIVSGQSTLISGEFEGNHRQGDIELVNLGIAAPARPIIEPPKLAIPTDESLIEQGTGEETPVTASQPLATRPPIEQSENTVAVTAAITSEDEEIFQAIENKIGQEFAKYFGLNEAGGSEAGITLRQTQNNLKDVARTSDITPAIVYVYFVPDVASATSHQLSSSSANDTDQLEIMLISSEGEPTRHRQWGVTRAQVDEVAQILRQQTTSQFSTEQQYLPPAQQLYDWIMAPIADTLEQQNVQSLGFIMDTGLRTLPLATLHDGAHYLVENYSLGILPTLGLTEFENPETKNRDFRNADVLAMGASKFEQQPDLPAVDEEISLITDSLWQGNGFLNEDFVLENLQAQIKDQDYGILHLATHANFESDNLDNSYIQMWGEQLTLSEVSQLELNKTDIDLIILSACNTAIGALNSEYGFAGFAIRAGTPTALASLWPVNDEGTLGFMSQFYSSLRQAPVRAEALRQAQINLISGEVGIEYGEVYGSDGETIVTIPELSDSGQWDFSHPFYWSAFTMIGNPW